MRNVNLNVSFPDIGETVLQIVDDVADALVDAEAAGREFVGQQVEDLKETGAKANEAIGTAGRDIDREVRAGLETIDREVLGPIRDGFDNLLGTLADVGSFVFGDWEE